MRTSPRRRGARPGAAARTAALLAGAALAGGCSSSAPGSAPPDAGATAAPARVGAPPAPFRALRALPSRAAPARVRIPAIDVDAEIGPMGLQPDGAVEVPQRWEQVGWWSRGARPGDDGPAVLLGHVDSKAGPAVFFRLSQLRAGDVVEVVGRDGVPVRFRVDRLVRYAKTGFPTDEVYLPTLQPELRLVTCGGPFDRATGHYVENLVAYASLA